MIRKVSLVSIVAIICLSLTACSGSQIFTAIETALQAISALQAFLPTAGLSPVLSKQIGDYASAAAAGVGQCSSLLAAGGDTVTLVSKCGQALTAAVKPVLPPGTPTKVVGIVDAVYGEIQVVYAIIESTATPSAAKPAAPKGIHISVARKPHAAAPLPTAWYPSKHDASKLLGLATQAQKLAGVK